MDQGTSACSILAPVRQGAPPDQGGDSNLDDAVASLLSRPDSTAASGDDHDLLQLGSEFDAAHERWREAVEAAREPTERHDAVLAVVRTRGHLTMADHEAAEALPGFRKATRAEEDALNVVADLSERALKMSAYSIEGLAVQARCLIPCVWPEGAFEEKGAPEANEDVDYEAVRQMIASCCAAAGIDWKGAPLSGLPSPKDQAPDQLWAAIHLHRETKSAFEAAARAADRVQARIDGRDSSDATMKPARDRELAASHAHDQAYRDLLRVRPQTLTQLLIMLRHLADHEPDHRGIADEPDVLSNIIGAVEGMRLSEMPAAAAHDLSRLSIAELDHLARIADQVRESLMAVEQTAFCYDRAKSSLTIFGELVEAEGERFSYLRDHAVNEVARRRPTGEDETDRRLEVMVRQDLLCNGHIEPKLLSEVVATWGAR